jgi:hypothetical protein
MALAIMTTTLLLLASSGSAVSHSGIFAVGSAASLSLSRRARANRSQELLFSCLIQPSNLKELPTGLRMAC